MSPNVVFATLENADSFIKSRYFWGGIFLGLQDDTTATSNDCYSSYV